MKLIFTTFFGFLLLTTVSAQSPQLIADINAGTAGSFGTTLLGKNYALFNNEIYFAATIGTTNTELWKSDGTETGTILVKDINVGSSSSGLTYFKVVNGYLLFVATNGSSNNGRELWRSDGTEAGTVMVKDINPGTSNGSPSFQQQFNGFYVWNDVLYFTADDGVHGNELWRSDGTDAGTYLLKDMNTTGNNTNSQLPCNFVEYGDKLYFRGNDGIHGNELWVTDGTEAGTMLLKDINPNASSSDPGGLITANGLIFFAANGGASQGGLELWKSDGTEGGTVRVKDINTSGDGLYYPFSLYDNILYSIGNTVYFGGNDVNERELWRSDGTEAGTIRLSNIFTPFAIGPRQFTSVGNILLFRMEYVGDELWRSDGTTTGTYAVADINPSTFSSFTDDTQFFKFDDHVLISLQTNANGKELWRSNGTAAGTYLVADINPGTASSIPGSFMNFQNYLYFSADSTGVGREWWKLYVEPTATITAAQTLDCFGDTDGALNVNVSGGVPPYTFEWSAATLQGQNPTDVGAGNYTVTITDANENTTTAVYVLTQPAQITGNVSFTPASNGQTNGTAEVNVTGGTPPFTYAWNNPAASTTALISNIAAGTYTVTVTDDHGCSTTFLVMVTEITATITTTQLLDCNGDTDGAVTANLEGGTQPFTYDWSVAGQHDASLTNIGAGTYTVTITDATGVTSSATVVIAEPTALSTTTSSIAATYSNANGSASVSVMGGTPAYSYLWSNGAVSAAINNVVAGDYSVTVTDANGCTIVATVTVDMSTAVDEAFSNSIQVTPTLSNGQFTVHSSQPLSGLRLCLLDTQGHVVQEWPNVATGEMLNLNSPVTGLFYLRIIQADKIAVKKLVFVK